MDDATILAARIHTEHTASIRRPPKLITLAANRGHLKHKYVQTHTALPQTRPELQSEFARQVPPMLQAPHLLVPPQSTPVSPLSMMPSVQVVLHTAGSVPAIAHVFTS